MTDVKIPDSKEYDVYRDSLFRYLGNLTFLTIEFRVMQFFRASNKVVDNKF